MTDELIKPDATGARAAGGHNYLSTACAHLLHDECRRECKFCAAECSCACHAGECAHCLHERSWHDGTGWCPVFQPKPPAPPAPIAPGVAALLAECKRRRGDREPYFYCDEIVRYLAPTGVNGGEA